MKNLPERKTSTNYERVIKAIKYLKITSGQTYLDIIHSKFEINLG